jgi:hypothetical protein
MIEILDTTQGVTVTEEVTEAEEKPDTKIEKARAKLIEDVAAQLQETLEQRDCWLLNNHSATRNSHITLMLKYWKQYEAVIFDGSVLSPEACIS